MEDKSLQFATDVDTSLRDFYWKYDREMIPYDSTKYERLPSNRKYDETLKDKYANKNIYLLQFTNKGGLVSPVIIQWTYTYSSKEIEEIPAQIWRMNESKFSKVFIKDKEVASIKLDPMRVTADIDESNNEWPKIPEQSRFQVFKARQKQVRETSNANNPMQKAEQKDKKAF